MTADRRGRKSERRGRNMARAAFLESRRGEFDARALSIAMVDFIAEAAPVGDEHRWVPIGPSVVRNKTPEGGLRMSGRVRDVAVSNDGARAYAASARGGVWYTQDAGTTWQPVGPFAGRPRTVGGTNTAQRTASLLVSFGGSVDGTDDYVMVGTGERSPNLPTTVDKASNFSSVYQWRLATLAGKGGHGGGVGVLAARGPTVKAAADPTWEPASGLNEMEGFGILRLARRPGRTAGAVGDEVLAATSGGLFRGLRVLTGGVAGWQWSKVTGFEDFINAEVPVAVDRAEALFVTDVRWMKSGSTERIFVCVNGLGLAFSDALGASGTWKWVDNLNKPTSTVAIEGRMSMAFAAGATEADLAGSHLYVLGEASSTPSVWKVAGVFDPAPTAVSLTGVPNPLWGSPPPGQRDYDQAIAVDLFAGTERVYLGGSYSRGAPHAASLWCFDVTGAALVASPGISTKLAVAAPFPPDGAGADEDGLIGQSVHADVHSIRVVAPGGTTRHVWVGCDGGVYVSAQAGRQNSFSPRVTGMASLEAGFQASHPTSSHFVTIGCQDNGVQVRQGDTVWERIMDGDGGGVIFHPARPEIVVGQYTFESWRAQPSDGFQDPVFKWPGGGFFDANGREHLLSAFYSGLSATSLSATTARLALGTNRVWLTDDLGVTKPNTWKVLPLGGAAPVDACPGGTDPAALRTFGVPLGGTLGAVIQLRWTDAHRLLALYGDGIVAYEEDPVTKKWTGTVLLPGSPGGPTLGPTVLTDIAPVPESTDFYLTTTGAAADPTQDTVWFFDSAALAFTATGLRTKLPPLDPAYAVVVDPKAPDQIYVGTVTGVWKGTKQATLPPTWRWDPFVNGLPETAVQDLGIWTDPGGTDLRLLRAATQARGVWEVDLRDIEEPKRTYARVHFRDDRRILPARLANPRRSKAAALEPSFASPDVLVRPRAFPAGSAAPGPAWTKDALGNPEAPIEADTKLATRNLAFELWTFQTAFRWHFPAVTPTGLWSDQFGDLVVLKRVELGLSADAMVDQDLWEKIVGDTRLNADGSVTAAAAMPLAVYRAPWHVPASMTGAATEVDLLESVHAVNEKAKIWHVYREPWTIDVLLHHRDTVAVPANGSFAALLWISGKAAASLLASNLASLPSYARALASGAPTAPPVGWNVAGAPLNRLPVALDARMPRAISVDLAPTAGTGVGELDPAHNFVLFAAAVGSTVDPFTAVAPAAATTAEALTLAWPHLALRLVELKPRP